MSRTQMSRTQPLWRRVDALRKHFWAIYMSRTQRVVSIPQTTRSRRNITVHLYVTNSEPSICHELSESSQYHKHKESSKYHELNESSTCHECKRLSSPRTEEIRLKIFGSPDWTVFPSTLLSDRDSHLLPWKLRFWGLPWIFFSNVVRTPVKICWDFNSRN